MDMGNRCGGVFGIGKGEAVSLQDEVETTTDKTNWKRLAWLTAYTRKCPHYFFNASSANDWPIVSENSTKGNFLQKL